MKIGRRRVGEVGVGIDDFGPNSGKDGMDFRTVRAKRGFRGVDVEQSWVGSRRYSY